MVRGADTYELYQSIRANKGKIIGQSRMDVLSDHSCSKSQIMPSFELIGCSMDWI